MQSVTSQLVLDKLQSSCLLNYTSISCWSSIQQGRTACRRRYARVWVSADRVLLSVSSSCNIKVRRELGLGNGCTLMRMGMPCNGPRSFPYALSSSNFDAVLMRTFWGEMFRIARKFIRAWPSRLIWSSRCSTGPTLEILPLDKSFASSEASKVRSSSVLRGARSAVWEIL